LPVKLLEYLAAGLPVIASESQEWSEIIREGNCGITVNPLDRVETAEAINWIIDNPAECAEMGRRGKQLVAEKYNWETESVKLVQFYEKLSGWQATSVAD
ncbi:MAG: glycosyltransferase, partial [Planctomycetota bacterium]|nr:glycosyltransferase [Planctomycetota bacterium]